MRQEALAAAMAEPEPGSLAAATRLRRHYPPEVAAWAQSQAELRRRARSKFPDADRMLFTRTGLEQATRPAVAQWRARRLRERGVTKVVDLGCGIGSDAMAFAEAGMEVIAVDADETTVECATANLALVGAGPAIHARAQDVTIPPDAAVFVDPARRNERGRSWDVADFSPDWTFVTGLLAQDRPVVAKLGPGMPKHLVPEAVGAVWVSHDRDVVEVSLWNQEADERAATLLSSTQASRCVTDRSPRRELAVGPLGSWISEPSNAVIRAGLLDAVAPDQERWLLQDKVAYLSSHEPLRGGLVTNFEVLEVSDFDPRTLRKWAREHDIGALEIKVRAIDVDPAELRRGAKLRGRRQATVILARTLEGTKLCMVRRTPTK